MEETVINQEQANSDLQKWLDFKKVSQSRKTSQRTAINICTQAIADGNLIVNDDFSLTQKLKWEIGDEKKYSEVKYKARISVKEYSNALRKAGAVTADEQLMAAAAAASDLSSSIMDRMDTEDASIAKSIGLFFM